MSALRSGALLAALLCLRSIPEVRADALVAAAPDSGGTAIPDFGGGGTAVADQSAASDLGQVVVTATRTAQPLDHTGADMSVISGAELQSAQRLVLSDALAQLPGLSVTRDGGPGQTTTLSIRGADPGQSLLLIDGVRINDPSAPDGAPVLADLLVNDIDRVEVLRGPQSTLYGSDAIGGVVNLITQRGGNSPLALHASAEGGSFGTTRYNGALAGTDGPFEYGGAVNYYDTGGVSAADVRDGNSEPDGYVNLGATGSVRIHAGDHWSLDLRGIYTRSRSDFDGYPPPDYVFEDDQEFSRSYFRAAYGALNGSWFDGRFTQRLALIGTDSDRRYYGLWDPETNAFTPAQNSYYQGDATRLEYQTVIRPSAANELTAGAETELTTLGTQYLGTFIPSGPADVAPPTTGRDRLNGYYLQWQSTPFQPLTLIAGYRYDFDSQFGGHSSVKFNAAWRLFDGGTVLRANYGDGFKAPTLFQQLSPDPYGRLQPERAAGWELGVDQSLADRAVRISGTFFRRQDRDKIEDQQCAPGVSPGCESQGIYYYNVDRAHATGVETELVARAGKSFSLYANYTNLRALDDSAGLALLLRPHVTVNAGVNWTPDTTTTVNLSYHYLGTRESVDPNTFGRVTVAADETVNLAVSIAVGDGLQVFGRIENLFNYYAEPAAGYGALGRAAYAGIRLSL
jgi:vitamin B12 transporter